MKLFDSHCHINDPCFEKDLGQTIERAEKAGVLKMMVVGITMKESRRAVEIAEKFPGCMASVGIHPHDASSSSDKALTELKQMAQTPVVKAWGEVGLDFNRMFSPARIQEKWFIRQMEAACQLGLPLIFHERDSQGRFAKLLSDHAPIGLKGVVHCFSGTPHELEKYLSMGLYIGITGIVTISKRGRKLREMVAQIPEDRLLVETDAPYLTPAPEKNKTRRNEPAFVKSVLLKLAETKKTDPEDLAEIIWDNTCRLFNII